MHKFLEFHLRQQPYAVPIGSVREINRMSTISPVPGAAGYVAGVMNLRGKVIPVVDLRVRFGFDKITATKETCIIVVESNGRQGGLIVDSVSGVAEFTEKDMEPSPDVGAAEEARFVTGIGKTESRVVILIDPAAITAKEENVAA